MQSPLLPEIEIDNPFYIFGELVANILNKSKLLLRIPGKYHSDTA
jgi:hypothetical protein